MIFQDQGFDWIEITDRYDLRGGRRVFLKGSAVAGSGNYGPGQPRVPDQLQPPYLCGCHNPPRPIGDHKSDPGVTDRDQEIADQRSAEARDMKLHSPGCRGAFGVPCAEWCEVYTHNRSQPGPSTPEPGQNAPDIEGRVHFLLPYEYRMACGRKVGEHWSSALNIEAVNCPACLNTQEARTAQDQDDMNTRPAGADQ